MTSTRVKRAIKADRVTTPKSKEEQTSARVASLAAKILTICRTRRRSQVVFTHVYWGGSVARIRVSDIMVVCASVITQTKDRT